MAHVILLCAPNPCQNHHELFTVIGEKNSYFYLTSESFVVCEGIKHELNLRVQSKKIILDLKCEQSTLTHYFPPDRIRQLQISVDLGTTEALCLGRILEPLGST